MEHEPFSTTSARRDAHQAGGSIRERLRFAFGTSPIGRILLGVSETGIRWCSVGDDAASMESRLRERFPKAMFVHDPDGLSEHMERLASLWTDAPSNDPFSLDPVGTPFQKSVWDQLRRIPPGRTITYGELARRVGNPKSVRAVAQACGANPILMLVPCHRVIGADGSLTGFAAGVERKRELLRREGVQVAG